MTKTRSDWTQDSRVNVSPIRVRDDYETYRPTRVIPLADIPASFARGYNTGELAAGKAIACVISDGADDVGSFRLIADGRGGVLSHEVLA